MFPLTRAAHFGTGLKDIKLFRPLAYFQDGSVSKEGTLKMLAFLLAEPT